MDSLESLGGQMKGVESQLSQYDANLPSEIESQLQKAYSPALKSALETTKNLQSDYLGRYYDTTSMGPGMAGTTAKDLSPTQKLGVMGRELGSMSGDLNAASKYSDYLGGQMQDMYSKALQAAQLGQQNLADKYSRISQQYQMAWQEAENAKNRAAAAANSGGGFSPNMGDYFSSQPEQQAPSKTQVLKSIQGIANDIANQRGQGAQSYAYGGYNFGSIDNAFNSLMNQASELNYNLNPEWLWQQLGNNNSPYSTPNPIL